MKNKHKNQNPEHDSCNCNTTKENTCPSEPCQKEDCVCETPSPEQIKADLEQELAKQKDAFLRLYAEFDNYKKRTQRERVEWLKTASQEVLEAVLPVVDDFERGLSEASKHSKEELVTGFEMIYNKLVEILRQRGLVAIQVEKGDEFNVDLHEAIAKIPVEDNKLKEKIVDVTQKGYKLGDKIIRYAKVVVGA